MRMQPYTEGGAPIPEVVDPRIEKTLDARNHLQMLLMQKWSGGDDAKAVEWSEKYSEVFEGVFPPHTEPGEKKFLILQKMQEYVASDAEVGNEILEKIQANLDACLPEHSAKEVKSNSLGGPKQASTTARRRAGVAEEV